MKRPLKPEERRLWDLVVGTVKGRAPDDAQVRKVTVKTLKKAKLGKRVPVPEPVEAPPADPSVDPAWAALAKGVQPLPGRPTPKAKPAAPRTDAAAAPLLLAAEDLKALRNPVRAPRNGVDPIEPRRKRRITRERDPLEARLDLHGMDQDRARPTLEAFLRRASDEGYRSVLVITGKGKLGTGVLRRYVPEWLAAPHLSDIVAGVSQADRHHGGEGALYVALKRRL
ncbi:Smr/MutS family protein [Caulobacter sp. NIBR2454]|uniref:Smr/MutS family protein n=1 Tax=Caulobacter sp. NIBR2454 TaxID=3015996 RepID=UPI0022B6EEAB|nr:Smr/MutS family protein [Caulobacter sp. NIBR2454]